MQATLPELGMDSMVAVEIKQFLEREKQVFLTPSDIRSLTFARLVWYIILKKQRENTFTNFFIKDYINICYTLKAIKRQKLNSILNKCVDTCLECTI